MLPKRKQTKNINKKKTNKTKHQCKQSRKRTGESLDDIIQEALVPKRQNKIAKALKLGLGLGGIGLGIYATTHKNNVINWYDKMYQEGQYNQMEDDYDKKLQRIIMDLKSSTNVLDRNYIKQVMDDAVNAIRTKRTPVWISELPFYAKKLLSDDELWKDMCEQQYVSDSNNVNWNQEKNVLINHLNEIKYDYNEAFHGEAAGISSYNIKQWINHLNEMKPTVIGYKDLAYWIPKIKNLIWSKKPGTFISNLEGNVAEYLKSEDIFKNIANNAENENSEADKIKINNLKQYLETLNKIYKETFNY